MATSSLPPLPKQKNKNKRETKKNKRTIRKRDKTKHYLSGGVQPSA
jgi:hypothetical protein